MQNKNRVCIMLNPKLKEAAQWYADQRGLSLSAYIADCLLWQISHDQKRLDQGKTAFTGKPREKTIAQQPLTIDQLGTTAEYKKDAEKIYGAKMRNIKKEEREKQERLATLKAEAESLAHIAMSQKYQEPSDFIWSYLREANYTDFEISYIGEHACNYLPKVKK